MMLYIFFYLFNILFQNASGDQNHRSCVATVIGTHYFDRNLYKSEFAFTELHEEFVNLDRYFLQHGTTVCHNCFQRRCANLVNLLLAFLNDDLVDAVQVGATSRLQLLLPR